MFRTAHTPPVVYGIDKVPARFMLRAIGFTGEDFKQPEVGVASSWASLSPLFYL